MTTTWPISYCTLDLSPLFGKPETLVEQVRAAAKSGFGLVGPDMFALRAYVEAGHSLERLAEVFQECGVEAFDIAGTNISADRDAARREATELLGYAAALGAPWLQARITAPLDDDTTLDTYREVRDLAASFGVGLGLEYSPFTPINGLRLAREVLDEVRSDAVPRQGIVVDTWHLSYTDGLDPMRDLPAADLAFVQLDDAEAGAGQASRDTMHHRAMPGEGVLDVAAFVGVLRDIGFTGVVTVEVLNASLRELPVEEYVQRAYDSTVSALR